MSNATSSRRRFLTAALASGVLAGCSSSATHAGKLSASNRKVAHTSSKSGSPCRRSSFPGTSRRNAPRLQRWHRQSRLCSPTRRMMNFLGMGYRRNGWPMSREEASNCRKLLQLKAALKTYGRSLNSRASLSSRNGPPKNHLRHLRFMGLRGDKKTRDITRE